jgi:hypothetical protein
MRSMVSLPGMLTQPDASSGFASASLAAASTQWCRADSPPIVDTGNAEAPRSITNRPVSLCKSQRPPRLAFTPAHRAITWSG